MENKKYIQKIQKIFNKGVALHFKGLKSPGSISAKLRTSLDLRIEGGWNSAYNTEPIVLPSGDTLTIRISDHKAKPEQFKEHFNTKYNVVILIGKNVDEIEVENYVDSQIYSEVLYKTSCFNEENREQTITEILKGLQSALETGEYDKGEMGEWVVMQVMNGLGATINADQYNSIKEKYPDAILLFREGDFYEAYRKDAEVVSEICGITLTQHKGDYLSAIPYHSLDNYLPKLVKAGKRVAICEPLDGETMYFNRYAQSSWWEYYSFADPMKVIAKKDHLWTLKATNRYGVEEEIYVNSFELSKSPIELSKDDWCVYTFDKREAVAADIHRTYRILSITKDSAKLSDGTSAHSLSMLEYRPINHKPAFSLGEKISYKKGNILTSDGKVETYSKTSGEYEIAAYRYYNNDVEYYLKPENYTFDPWVSEKDIQRYNYRVTDVNGEKLNVGDFITYKDYDSAEDELCAVCIDQIGSFDSPNRYWFHVGGYAKITHGWNRGFDYKKINLPVSPKFKIGSTVKYGKEKLKVSAIYYEDGQFYYRLGTYIKEDFTEADISGESESDFNVGDWVKIKNDLEELMFQIIKLESNNAYLSNGETVSISKLILANNNNFLKYKLTKYEYNIGDRVIAKGVDQAFDRYPYTITGYFLTAFLGLKYNIKASGSEIIFNVTSDHIVGLSKTKAPQKTELKYFVVFDNDRDQEYYPESWGCQVGLAKNKTEFVKSIKQYDRQWNTNYSRAWGTVRELTPEELDKYIEYYHALKDAELEFIDMNNTELSGVRSSDNIFTQAFNEALRASRTLGDDEESDTEPSSENVFVATNYDKKHKLNTAPNLNIPESVVESLRKEGLTIENIDELTKQGFPVYKYRTQITIHGICPELKSKRSAGGYVTLERNENKSLGINWRAIDEKKKYRIGAILDYFGWYDQEDSKGYVIKTYIKCPDQEQEAKMYIDLKEFYQKVLSKNLMFGTITIGRPKWSGWFADPHFHIYIKIDGIYEKNIKPFIEAVLDKPYSEIEKEIAEKKAQEEKEEAEREARYQKEREEAEKQAAIRAKKIEQMKAAKPFPAEFVKVDKLEVGDIAIMYRVTGYGDNIKVDFKYKQVYKAFGKTCWRECDVNGKTLGSGQEILYENPPFFVKRASAKPKTSESTASKPVNYDGPTDFKILRYSDKAYILVGNTQAYAKILGRHPGGLGLKWGTYWKNSKYDPIPDGKGWMFSENMKSKVEDFIRKYQKYGNEADTTLQTAELEFIDNTLGKLTKKDIEDYKIDLL